MKKYKNYIILGFILLILIAGIVVINNIEEEPEEPVDTSEIIEIYSYSNDEISSVNIKNEYGEYTIVYGDEIIIKDRNIEKDDEKLKSLRTDVSGIYTYEVIENSQDKLEDFGLKTPVAVLKLSLKDNSDKVLNIGNQTPSQNGYYATVSGDSNVYIIRNTVAEAVLRKLDYYRNTVLFAVDVLKVNKLTYKKGDRKVSFIKNDESIVNRNVFAAFNMTEPYSWEAESGELEKVIALLNQLAIEEYVSDDEANLSQYGLGNSATYVSITENDGKVSTLNIGNNKDGFFYVSLNDDNTVYRIDAAGFEFLDYEPTAFLQRFVAIRSIDNLKKIRYIYENTDAEFEIKKIDLETHDIKYKGKLIDQKVFKEMYTELISMSTAGTLNYVPSGEPMLKYTFTYLDGEEETIEYYKYDERKIAALVRGKVTFFVDSSEFNKRVKLINEIINKF